MEPARQHLLCVQRRMDRALANVSALAYDNGFYVHDVYAGGNNTAAVTGPILLGTVHLNTAGLADGDYIVQINGSSDQTSLLGFNAQTEAITGQGIVHVPEPASILMLSGAFVALRRRW